MRHIFKRGVKAPKPSISGASLVEYGMTVGLIAVLAIGSVMALGEEVDETMTSTAETLASAIGGAGAGGSGGPGGGTEVADVDPELVGIGAFTHVVYSEGLTTGTFGIPAGTQQDDLMVAVVLYHVDGGAQDLNVPAGWTRELTQTDNDNLYEVAVLTKKYAASDGSSVTMSQTAPHQMSGQIYSLRGDGIGIRAAAVNNGTTVDHVVPSFQSVDEGAFMITAAVESWVNASGNTTITYPGGGWTPSSPAALSKHRLGIAYNTGGVAGTTYSGLTYGFDSASDSWGTFAIQIDD